MRLCLVALALLSGCLSAAPNNSDPCASCPAFQACDDDDVCRSLCNSARDCAACDSCDAGMCRPLEGCDPTTGSGTGENGDPCAASAQCAATAPICDDACRACTGDDECDIKDSAVPFCTVAGTCTDVTPVAPVLPPIVVSGAADTVIRIDWRSLATDGDSPVSALELESFALIGGAAGTLAEDVDGALSYDPQGAFTSFAASVVQVVAATARIRDERQQLSAQASLTINVVGVNDPPVLVGDGPFQTNTLDGLLIDVAGNDGDLDTGDDSQFLSQVSPPMIGASQVGSAVVESGQIRFQPEHPTTGAYEISYVISDAGGASVNGSVTVEVALGLQVSIDSFTASRDHIVGAQPTTLSWSTTNASSCTLTGAGETISTETNGTAVAYAPTSPSAAPTLTCQGNGGPVEQSLPVTWQPAIFVDDDVVPGGEGRSWEDAFVSLQAAIDAADNEPPAQIWIKAGTYRASGANVSVAALTSGAALYGGFSQTLTGVDGDPAQRPRDADAALLEPTTLDGDVLGDDPALTDNSFHVVVVAGDTHLDGLRLVHGNAGGGATDGGGLYGNGSANVSLWDVEVSGNRATYRGGGLYFIATSISLDDVVVTGNVVEGNPGNPGSDAYGGGIAGDIASSITITDSTISGNQAIGGKGSNGGGNLTLLPGRPGGHGTGGAIYLWEYDSSLSTLTITNSAVLNNTARGGDGGNGGHRLAGGGGSVGGIGGNARGGAIDATNWVVTIVGGTTSSNVATGGNGGDGGDAYSDAIGAFNGGDGGDAGHGIAGGFALRSGTILSATGVELALNHSFGGGAGDGGDGWGGGLGGNGANAGYASTQLIKAETSAAAPAVVLDGCLVWGNGAIDSTDNGLAGNPGGSPGGYTYLPDTHFDLVCTADNWVCVEASAVSTSSQCAIDAATCP